MKRKEQILKAAYDILGNDGLEELHARTVAKAIGINHATVHYYFPHREDLLLGVGDYTLHQLIRDRLQFQQGSKSAQEQIESELALVEAYCRPASRFIKVLGCLYVAGIASEGVRQKLGAIWDEWHSLVNAQVVKAFEEGAIDKGSPYQNPELLMTTFFGMCLASHMVGDKVSGQSELDIVFNSMFPE